MKRCLNLFSITLIAATLGCGSATPPPDAPAEESVAPPAVTLPGDSSTDDAGESTDTTTTDTGEATEAPPFDAGEATEAPPFNPDAGAGSTTPATE